MNIVQLICLNPGNFLQTLFFLPFFVGYALVFYLINSILQRKIGYKIRKLRVFIISLITFNVLLLIPSVFLGVGLMSFPRIPCPSFKNLKYKFWLNVAIQKKDIDLCNNVEGLDLGDILGSHKDYAVNSCRLTYIIKTNNIDMCHALSVYERNVCLMGLAKRLKRLDLCEEITRPEDKMFESRIKGTCEDNIKNNKTNGLLAF